MGGHVVAHEGRRHAGHERADATPEEESLEGGNHLARCCEPAEPHAGAQDLRERPGADDPAMAIERVERRQRLALEAQLPVGVVLEDERVVLVGELDQLVPPAQGLGRARGVLEVHDRVDELAAPSLAAQRLEPRADGGGHDALGVDGHVEDLRAMALDRDERSRERRGLGDDGVAGIDEGAEGERERVAGAVGDDDVLGLDLEPLEPLVLLADQLAQPPVALRLPVGHRGRALGLHHPGGRLDHPVVGE